MKRPRRSTLREPVVDDCHLAEVTSPAAADRAECLNQILRAFFDIADRDDIHQAAERLRLVQQWIDNEAQRVAADPIFVNFRLV
jgi:hypothetical protein